MKKNGASRALLAPDANGWRVSLPDGVTQTVKTLGEAAAAVPAGATIHLALPAQAALLERLTLPSTNREELEGMVQLQLEKTLPYPIEEVTSDFDVIKQGENESTLISVAAHTPQLDKLCEPLRTSSRLPHRVTLFAAHVAASCPADQTVLCVWQEEEQIVVAICENGKVSTAQTIAGADPAALQAELPAMLLRAELEGVPVAFEGIRLEHGLLPAAWESEQKRIESSGRLKQQLQIAAFIYLLLVAGAFIYLAWMKMRVRKLDREIAITQPQIEFVAAQEARWNTLQPAIDPSRYPIEVLLLCWQSRPSSEVKVTVFEMKSDGRTPTQFIIEGEAPSPHLAIEYGEKLRAEKGLDAFKIETANPKILKDDRAQFRFFGTL